MTKTWGGISSLFLFYDEKLIISKTPEGATELVSDWLKKTHIKLSTKQIPSTSGKKGQLGTLAFVS